VIVTARSIAVGTVPASPVPANTPSTSALPDQPGRHIDPALPAANLVDQDIQVPVLGGGLVRHVNLDLSASTPSLVSVAQQIQDLQPYYSSVQRGSGYLSEKCTGLVEGARADIAAHVNARPDDLVIFTRNTTDALNLLATAVPGDTVVLDIEHHANLLPWRSRRVVESRVTLAETLAAVRAELASRPAALLSVTGASNVTGELLPLAQFADIAHAHGARLAVDGAQLVPHRRIDMLAIGVDYLAFSGHKLYAPFGAGVLIGRADWLDAAPPYLAGGGAVGNVTLTEVEWKSGVARHEAGSPNIFGNISIATALADLTEIGWDTLREHESTLRDYLHAELGQINGIRILQGFPDAPDRLGLAAWEVSEGSVGLLAAALSAEHGVSVRAGRFCAHPLVARLATRRNGLRASLGAGSTLDDIDRLVDALARLLKEGPRYQYERGSHGWHPHHDDRRC